MRDRRCRHRSTVTTTRYIMKTVTTTQQVVSTTTQQVVSTTTQQVERTVTNTQEVLTTVTATQQCTPDIIVSTITHAEQCTPVAVATQCIKPSRTQQSPCTAIPPAANGNIRLEGQDKTQKVDKCTALIGALGALIALMALVMVVMILGWAWLCHRRRKRSITLKRYGIISGCYILA